MAPLGTLIIVLSAIAQSGGCSAQERFYPERAQIEAYRVTGVRTRTAVTRIRRLPRSGLGLAKHRHAGRSSALSSLPAECLHSKQVPRP